MPCTGKKEAQALICSDTVSTVVHNFVEVISQK